MENHAKPHDFSGVKKELQGIDIPNPKGGNFQHIDEMQKASAGLENGIKGLKNSLKNPNLSSEARQVMSDRVKNAEEVLQRMKDTLNGK